MTVSFEINESSQNKVEAGTFAFEVVLASRLDLLYVKNGQTHFLEYPKTFIMLMVFRTFYDLSGICFSSRIPSFTQES